MITADTITDEQIRELHDALVNNTTWTEFNAYRESAIALGMRTTTRERRVIARARCADILNARTPEAK